MGKSSDIWGDGGSQSQVSGFSSAISMETSMSSPDMVALDRLSCNLENLLLDPTCLKFADVDIVLAAGDGDPDDAVVGVYRCILAARCRFFLDLFSPLPVAATAGEKPQLELAKLIPGGRHIGRDALVAVLVYIYTGRCRTPPLDAVVCLDDNCDHEACRPVIDFVVQCTYAASGFQISELVSLFQRRLSYYVKIALAEDLVHIILVASTCELPDLLRNCIKRVSTSNLDRSYLEKVLPADVYTKEIRQYLLPVSQNIIAVDPEHEKRVSNIHKALYSDNVYLVVTLLKEYAITLDDVFAIHYAAAYCKPRVLTELLKLDSADVNLKNYSGYTPLHMACMRQEPDIILSLIQKGASVWEKTWDGRDALTICKRLMRQKNYNRESELRKNRSKAYFCVEILDQAIKWKLFILEDPRAIPFLADHSNTRLININNRERDVNTLFSSSLGAMGSLLGRFDELLHIEQRQSIQKLSIDLSVINIQLVKLSEARNHSLTAAYWMNDVRELSYDLEDCIDLLTDAKADKDLINKILGFQSRVDEVTERYHRYKLDSTISSRNVVMNYQLLMDKETHIADLVGIDSPITELDQWLTDEQQQQLNVVSIIGVGGVGKSTLAQKIWHKHRGQFECRAFVQIAKIPDMRRIFRNILSQVRPRESTNACQVHDLIDDLKEYLLDRRYFIILDDLWATSVWDVVSRGFPKGNCGSRILITTEIEKVAKACCGYQSRSILKIKPLSDDLSKELFGNIVFGSGKGCSQQFNGISDEIINKCAGLPLALISIANLLASQREALENWKYVQFFLHENLRKNPTFEEIMKQVLNLCYSCLPHCLKTCLLYFSIYPENYIILKEDLVRQWVAEGFIYAKKGEDIMDVATIYFDRLVNLGLIQCMDINDNDKKLCYAVHHMVFDLITSKATENNFVTIINYFQTTAELSEKVRRLSLHFGSATYATVPAGICGLFRLRYVQITCNVTVRLPTQMQCLTQLETFEINARVESVPSDIFHVPKLLHLCLRGGANFPNKKSFALDLGASGRVISLMGWSEMFCLFLQILEILPPICMFSRLPEWIARLHKLCTLKIVVKEFLKNDIDILTGLPALSILSLHVWQPTTERIIFHRAAFPALRCFKLWCGELYLVFQEEALPNLQRLKIGFNAHRGERYGNMLEGIENMLNLQTVDARIAAAAGAEESDRSAAEFAVMNAISKHSALTSFSIRRVDRVDEMVPQCPDLSADSSHPDPLQSDSTPNMTSESCISGVTSNPRLLDLVLSSSHHLEPDSLPTMTSEACTSEVTNLQESKPGTDHQRCRHPGCSKLARGSSGHCVAHGGGKRCQKTDCNKLLKGRIDFCKAHGGARVRCKHPGCRKNAVAGRTDFCIAHGGGKRKSRATVSGDSDVATSSKVTEGSMEGTTKWDDTMG
ncbi:disease resistance protein RGA5-like isoform X2 [Oryza glaberrima]|uniref:disease resistance protein RGA5-like isoform X2 n=1 Tax=Oryza glaberrima TaxID=4538 RepID=UPI00224BF1A1|nr:disease resistance protein RGA5-like isoform X2 [Oryza glaberrima]